MVYKHVPLYLENATDCEKPLTTDKADKCRILTRTSHYGGRSAKTLSASKLENAETQKTH